MVALSEVIAAIRDCTSSFPKCANAIALLDCTSLATILSQDIDSFSITTELRSESPITAGCGALTEGHPHEINKMTNKTATLTI
ncbi:hypothetical protein D3C87_1486890 [compost metagenome]